MSAKKWGANPPPQLMPLLIVCVAMFVHGHAAVQQQLWTASLLWQHWALKPSLSYICCHGDVAPGHSHCDISKTRPKYMVLTYLHVTRLKIIRFSKFKVPHVAKQCVLIIENIVLSLTLKITTLRRKNDRVVIIASICLLPAGAVV